MQANKAAATEADQQPRVAYWMLAVFPPKAAPFLIKSKATCCLIGRVSSRVVLVAVPFGKVISLGGESLHVTA